MYTNKEIWNVSYPIFLGLLAQNIINVTDTAFFHAANLLGGFSGISDFLPLMKFFCLLQQAFPDALCHTLTSQFSAQFSQFQCLFHKAQEQAGKALCDLLQNRPSHNYTPGLCRSPSQEIRYSRHPILRLERRGRGSFSAK